MSYAIYLRGRREPVVIGDNIGKVIQKNWAEGTLGKVVNLDGLTFERDMIRAIEANYRDVEGAEAVKQKSTADAQAERAKEKLQWEQTMARKASLPPEEKAKDLNMARQVWWAHTMQMDIPEDIVPEIIERQLLWFRDNQKNAYANPLCYRDIIEKHKRKLETHFTVNAMNFIGRQMMADNARAMRS